jgi:hypothetical protein
MPKFKSKFFIISGGLLLFAIPLGVTVFALTNQITGNGTVSINNTRYQTFNPDSRGYINIPELELSLVVGKDAVSQGLIGIKTVDHKQQSTRIAFTTKELLKSNAACNAKEGYIGVMTRFEGSSEKMANHNHTHGSSNFDFPGFHINYINTVKKSCVAMSSENYAAIDMDREWKANRALWRAMVSAKKL